ncbi:glutathione S-transferase family protein [Bradyrhizobium uaiense]|uniref:Glutathione S-transferase family protein n=1 Tax=Bradyrhizobium uaiense TaxID=2594946 RepID=A0A6P1BM30_9BRAD|nr:glutathione S-transferase family protein [Bradyrhizobium uaiense]NEU98642.1 glutathione S-transferase family protein [Bradyrhizobium uaiense]
MTIDVRPSIDTLAAHARSLAIGDPERRSIVSSGNVHPKPWDGKSPTPRLELFHFTMSICSQKIRAALFQIGAPFASSELVIMPPLSENYSAEYVKLRMASAIARSRPFVKGYSGSSSVENEGFDPLAVPTLVDHKKGEVVADSRVIAAYLDILSEGALVPLQWQNRTWNEIAIVDAIPHAGLFYGANPDGDDRPEMIRVGMQDAHSKKIELVRKRLAQLPADSNLREAYGQKIIKEEAGREFIAKPANMRAIIESTYSTIVELDRRLADSAGEWLIPDRFTLADIFWGVSLFRLLYLGYNWMWKDCSRVAGYSERLFAAPALQNGVINWPGHPPGERIERFQKR